MSRVKRYTFFPIEDETAYYYYKLQEAALWSSNELDFSRDADQYNGFNDQLKRIVDYVYAFFASADGIIAENIVLRFLQECDSFEQKAFYLAQLFIESVHSETYSLTTNTLIKDPNKRLELFQAMERIPVVKAKTEWMERWMNSELPRPYRLLAFVCAEGLFFQSSFFYIFWFRSKGLLPNIVFSNEQISKDENLHCCFAIELYNRLPKLTDKEAHDIFREAVEVESLFIDEVTPQQVEDLRPEDGKNYLKTLANYLLGCCGHPPLYEQVDLPNWTLEIATQQKSNFYEVRVGSYKQFSLSSALDWRGRIEKRDSDPYTDPDKISF
jgi:ribonucleotide reductase beta subunit family protein with ferritin-like domain